MNKLVMLFIFLAAITACKPPQKFVNKEVSNTPMPGFNTEGSDAKAIQIADDVMKAMGGRYAWDMTQIGRAHV